MTNKQLANQIRRTKGKIFMWIHCKHDGLYVAIEKSDLIDNYFLLRPEDEAVFKLTNDFLEPL
jgi:hypothetical protein